MTIFVSLSTFYRLVVDESWYRILKHWLDWLVVLWVCGPHKASPECFLALNWAVSQQGNHGKHCRVEMQHIFYLWIVFTELQEHAVHAAEGITRIFQLTKCNLMVHVNSLNTQKISLPMMDVIKYPFRIFNGIGQHHMSISFFPARALLVRRSSLNTLLLQHNLHKTYLLGGSTTSTLKTGDTF